VDFKTDHRWNYKTYYKCTRLAPYPCGYDIKVPWELSRCQHFGCLGHAYWITGDKEHDQEFVTQFEDWIESNPWPSGLNWACTMEVVFAFLFLLYAVALLLLGEIQPNEKRALKQLGVRRLPGCITPTSWKQLL